MPKDAEPPEAIELRLNRVPGLPAGVPEQPEHADVRCSVTETRLANCSLPAGTWHLRIKAEGFIPRFDWNRTLEGSGPVDLGEIALKRGALLFGQVVTSDGTPCSRHAKVELRPLMDRDLPGRDELTQEIENLTETAAVNEWGYFQFDAVPPRTYQLIALDTGFMPATLPRITIEANRQIELREPLVLHRALKLDLLISPPEDRTGTPWAITVYDASPLGSHDTVAKGHPVDGEWLSPPLAPGKYVVEVADAKGDRLGWRDVELDQTDQTLSIELSYVSVAGRSSAATSPLRPTSRSRRTPSRSRPSPTRTAASTSRCPTPGPGWRGSAARRKTSTAAASRSSSTPRAPTTSRSRSPTPMCAARWSTAAAPRHRGPR